MLINFHIDLFEGRLRSVVAKVLYCGLEVSEFELQSCYYVHFRTNSLGKDMSIFIPQAVG